VRSAQVRADGTRIRWVELPGVEPTRVYVHGLGACSAPYYAEAISHPGLSGHRSLMIDLVGFGFSDRPTDLAYTLEEHADLLAEALSQAGVSQAHLIGHSMGGAVVALLALRHPQLASRLLLVDPSLDPFALTDWTPAKQLSDCSESEFITSNWEQVLSQAGQHWASTIRLAGREAFYRSLINLSIGPQPTTRQILMELPLPRTLLYPQANGGYQGADELAASGVKLVSIPDCGHNISIENVPGFVSAVSECLGSSV
jgi:pimeloyl-ACP methyl ester carboxylesterase